MMPYPQTTTDMIENHLLSRVKKDFDYAKNGKAALELKIQEWRRIFNCRYKSDTLTKYGQHLMFIPKSTATVLRMHSAMFSSYFRQDDLARITAGNQKKASPIAAKIRNETLKWHFRHDISPEALMDRGLMDTLVDSTSCLKAGWSRKFNSQGQMIENKLTSEIVPLEDVFWDPDARMHHEIRWVVHEKDVDADYLRAKAMDPETGYDPVAVEMVINKSDQDRSTAFLSTQSTPENKERKTIKIWECWFKQLQLLPDDMIERLEYQAGGPTPETLAQPVVITTYKDDVVLRGPEPNPLPGIPFFFGRALTDKQEKRNSIAGKGPMSMFQTIQNEINAIRNQARVIAKRCAQGRIVIERGAGFDMEQLEKYRDAGIIYVNKAEGVKEFKTSDPSPALDRQLMVNEKDFQEGSGVTDEVQGLRPGGSKDTATAVNRRTELALNRLGTMVAIFNMTMVEPWVKFCDQLCGMYETREHVTQIMGADVMVPPLEMIWAMDANVKIEAGVNVIPTEQQIQEINMIVQTWGGLVQFVPQIAVPVLLAMGKRQLHVLHGDFKAEEQMIEQLTGEQMQAAPTPAEGGQGPAQRGSQAGPGQAPATPPNTIGPIGAHAQGGMRNAA